MLREHAHTVLDGAAPRTRMDLAGFHACSHSHCTAVKVRGLVCLSTWRAQWSRPAVGIRAVGSDLSANVEGSTASREATAPAGSTTDRDQTRHQTAADFARESRARASGAGGCSHGLYLQHDVAGGQRHKQDCRVSAAWPTKQQCAAACAAGGHACVKHVVEARAQRHVGPSEVEHLQSALEASPPLPAFGP